MPLLFISPQKYWSQRVFLRGDDGKFYGDSTLLGGVNTNAR